MSEKPKRRFQFSLRTLLSVMVVCAIASAGNPVVLLVLLYGGFFGYLAYSAGQLPPRMASHFDFRGNADQWIDRTAYLWMMGILGVFAPLLFPVIALAVNDAHLSRYAMWFACLLVGLFFAMHVRVVTANRESPPELFQVWPILFLFFACVTAWVTAFVAFRPVLPVAPAVKKAPATVPPIAPTATDKTVTNAARNRR